MRPCLNSFCARPSDRASCGTFEPPKITRTTEQDDEELSTTEVRHGPTVPVGLARRYRRRLQVRGSAGARVRRQHQRGTRRRPPPRPRGGRRPRPARPARRRRPPPRGVHPRRHRGPPSPCHEGRRAPGHPGPRGRPPAIGGGRRRSVRPPRRPHRGPTRSPLATRSPRWLAIEHEVPCFVYGPERSLPDVRRHAFRDLAPDAGPASPHPTAGATAVGARHPLVAFNVWMASPDLAVAKQVAAADPGAHDPGAGPAGGGRHARCR